MRPRLDPVVLLLALAGLVAAPAGSAAQESKALTAADYGRFETLSFRNPMSPDGAWLAVALSRVDGTRQLQVYAVGGTTDPVTVEEGRDPVFSDDSRWLAYRIGHSEEEAEKLRARKEPIRNSVGILELASGETRTVEGVAAFAFDGSGRFLAMQRYPEAESSEGPAPADLVVRDLDGGSELAFGNVTGFAWQDDGSLLAMTVTAPGEASGVHLYDAAGGSLRVLESGDAKFGQLGWREDGDDLVYLRSRVDDGWEEDTHVVVAWRGLAAGGSAARFDPDRDGFPEGMRVSEHYRPAFSDDGATVLFGIRERHAVPAKPEAEEAEQAEQTPPAEGPEEADVDEAPSQEPAASAAPVEKPAEVWVWHTGDETIVPMQQAFSQRLSTATYLAAWHLDEDRFVRIGTALEERTTLLPGQRYAVETDRSTFKLANQFDTDWNDIWLIDVASGHRRKVIEGVGYFSGASPEGRYLLYFRADGWHVYDIEADAHRALTAELPAEFVNDEYDTPVKRHRPPWGQGGWVEDDAAVLLYDRYDVWALRPSGVGALRLTDGAAEEVRHRVVRPDLEADAQPRGAIYLSLYGEWTKRQGFARASLGSDDPSQPGPDPGLQRLLWRDAAVGRLARAADAEVYSWVAEGYDDSPDIFVAGPDLADARQVTATNSFQADYAWGRSELVEYENAEGRRLQGSLHYPAGYEPGRRYPMIVYVYERLSQALHRYEVPSERDPYNPTVFNARGYFVLQPDIVYRDRYPGTSAVDCITAAVQAVLEKELVDPDRVGLVGHSWGGYEAAYVPTRTDIFAAAVAGAPLTNFFSMFGTVHWNQGLPESDHFETGQARMEVPYWEDLEAYVRESPVMHLQELNTPMLVFFGDKDGTVDWHQGVELYNYARRAGKFLVMLVYPGENHSARRKENQVDYHRRVLAWFDHFLQGADAPAWITEGQSVADREREVKRAGAGSRQ